MNCPDCTLICCDENVHEIIHGLTSLKWLHSQFSKGDFRSDLIDRMEKDISRIDKALRSCTPDRRKRSNG